MTYTPEQAAHFEALVMAINKAVIEVSKPEAAAEVGDAVHAIVSYNPTVVMNALVSVAASIAAQSGNYSVKEQRRELAEDLRKVFLRDYDAYEEMIAKVMARLVKH